MKRTFYPVGQGAFYVEKIKDFNLIYDCGSTNLDYIEREIDRYKETEIQLLVISHFDKDHYNGLEYLLRHKNVHRIMIPFLSDEMKILNIFDHLEDIEEEQDILDQLNIIISPNNYIRKISKNISDIQIIEVMPLEIEEKMKESIELKRVKKEKIQSGTPIIINEDTNWIIFPYNLSEKIPKIEKLLKDINNELEFNIYKDMLNASILLEKLNDKLNNLNTIHEKKIFINKLKKVYQANITKRNRYSLCLYSGLEKDYGESKIGCLYTGDYEAKKYFLQLNQAFQKYLSNIGTIQIPHHGSKENYHQNLMFPTVKKAVISVGKINGYGHPDADVVKNIGLSCRIFLVTENIESILQSNYRRV